MKKYIPVILSSVIFLILGISLGFIFGRNEGFESGFDTRDRQQRGKSIDELKVELRESERVVILDLIEAKGEINTRDEGGLFRVDYVHYLSGSISNNSAVSTIKDAKFKLTYLSKTKSDVGNEEVVVYEFIKPGRSINYKEKVNWPVEAESFQVTLIDVKVE